MSTQLLKIAAQAKREPKARFTSLAHVLTWHRDCQSGSVGSYKGIVFPDRELVEVTGVQDGWGGGLCREGRFVFGHWSRRFSRAMVVFLTVKANAIPDRSGACRKAGLVCT